MNLLLKVHKLNLFSRLGLLVKFGKRKIEFMLKEGRKVIFWMKSDEYSLQRGYKMQIVE